MRPFSLFAAAAIVSLLAGCLSSTPGPDPTTTPTVQTSQAPSVVAEPEPEPTEDRAVALEQAVVDYTNAYFAGDWDTAYERLWSDRCKADDDVRNEFLGVLMAQKVNYPDGDLPQPDTVTVDRLQGDTAVVTYDYSHRGVTQTITAQPWVYENGAWHFDAC